MSTAKLMLASMLATLLFYIRYNKCLYEYSIYMYNICGLMLICSIHVQTYAYVCIYRHVMYLVSYNTARLFVCE